MVYVNIDETAGCKNPNEERWRQTDDRFAPGERERGLEQHDVQTSCEQEECEIKDGKMLSSGSVFCDSGDCAICYRGKWLLPDALG